MSECKLTANRTNEITIVLSKSRTGEKVGGAQISISLKLNGILVIGSDVLVPEVAGSAGTYRVSYPILAIAKGVSYEMHLNVIVGQAIVIDEDRSVPVAG